MRGAARDETAPGFAPVQRPADIDGAQRRHRALRLLQESFGHVDRHQAAIADLDGLQLAFGDETVRGTARDAVSLAEDVHVKSAGGRGVRFFAIFRHLLRSSAAPHDFVWALVGPDLVSACHRRPNVQMRRANFVAHFFVILSWGVLAALAIIERSTSV